MDAYRLNFTIRRSLPVLLMIELTAIIKSVLSMKEIETVCELELESNFLLC